MTFITRQKEGTKNIIILKYAAVNYWLMWLPVIATPVAVFSDSAVCWLIAGFLWILFCSLSVPYWPVTFEIKRKMKEKSVSVKGSKYSFFNPLTYEWED
jgi:hypothetical protein